MSLDRSLDKALPEKEYNNPRSILKHDAKTIFEATFYNILV